MVLTKSCVITFVNTAASVQTKRALLLTLRTNISDCILCEMCIEFEKIFRKYNFHVAVHTGNLCNVTVEKRLVLLKSLSL